MYMYVRLYFHVQRKRYSKSQRLMFFGKRLLVSVMIHDWVMASCVQLVPPR